MRENLDIELLQTLVAIAATGSFALAAESVHRTQSAVSMQMKRLEEIVGQALFEKQGRRAVITPQGENLLLYARRILKLQDEALATFHSPDIKGEVRLGVQDDYVMRLVPPILARFAEQYPNVHIRLNTQSSTRLIAATAQGELDFSLVSTARSEAKHENLVSEPLVWVTSPKHVIHEARSIPIAIEANCLWSKWGQHALDKAGIHYRIAYTTFGYGGINAIVDAGLAVSIMSRNSVPENLRILTKADGFPELPITIIGLVVKNPALSPAAMRLADMIREELGVDRLAAA